MAIDANDDLIKTLAFRPGFAGAAHINIFIINIPTKIS